MLLNHYEGEIHVKKNKIRPLFYYSYCYDCYRCYSNLCGYEF